MYIFTFPNTWYWSAIGTVNSVCGYLIGHGHFQSNSVIAFSLRYKTTLDSLYISLAYTLLNESHFLYSMFLYPHPFYLSLYSETEFNNLPHTYPPMGHPYLSLLCLPYSLLFMILRVTIYILFVPCTVYHSFFFKQRTTLQKMHSSGWGVCPFSVFSFCAFSRVLIDFNYRLSKLGMKIYG